MNVSSLLFSTTFPPIISHYLKHSWAPCLQHGWGEETQQQVVKVFLLIALQADTSNVHCNCSQTHFYVPSTSKQQHGLGLPKQNLTFHWFRSAEIDTGIGRRLNATLSDVSLWHI